MKFRVRVKKTQASQVMQNSPLILHKVAYSTKKCCLKTTEVHSLADTDTKRLQLCIQQLSSTAQWTKRERERGPEWETVL